MSQTPLFSVLIANYNNGRYLHDAINSVLCQSYSNWEIVIVDDASTDNSWITIQEYAHNDHRIKSYRNVTNLKVGATKAKCAALAQGVFCGILDPDDRLHPEAIQKHIDTYYKHPDCSMVSSNHFICDAFFHEQSLNTLLYDPRLGFSYLASTPGGVCHFWSFNKRNYLQTIGFRSQYILAEDQDLFYQLEEVGKIVVLEEPLYYYRVHENSISKNSNTAKAFFFHVMAMLDAIGRRPYNLVESRNIRNAIIGFAEWGLPVIDKSLQKRLLYRTFCHFPLLIFRKSIFSVIYHLYRRE